MDMIYIAVAVILVVAAIIFYKRKKREKDMAAGIQIFDDNGDLIFDLANRTTYVIGTGHTGTSNSSLSDSRVVAGRTWVAVTEATATAVIPYFTITDGSIAWSFVFNSSFNSIQDVTFMYGVY